MGEGDGIIEAWLDGVQVIKQSGLTTSSVGRYFKRIYFSSNLNASPDRVMSVIFGRYRVYIVDPGW